MKTFRLIGMALLAIVFSLNFSSCSNDDDDNGGSDKPYDFKVNGIYYKITSDTEMTCEVKNRINNTNNGNTYSGNIVIPEIVSYKGNTYNVTSVGYNAFEWCSELTSITIPNNVTSIGERAFLGCTGLTEVIIGNGVTSIGQQSFSGCTSLRTITIPSSVNSIEYNAFKDCTNLNNIIIEDGTETLTFISGYYAFDNCSISTLYLGRDISYSSDYSPFKNKTTLVSVIIGNSVTSIGECAFYGCTGLTEITIPSSIISIDYNAFGDCTGLTEINSKNTTPPEITSITFNNVDKESCVLNVPKGSKSAYSNATYWKDFKSITEKDFSDD
ncbi:MAG: leucine-rich repeat domain-containing protein [Prevotella sp.]|nr:leucine-rich repeat domain-containing protein [Prevotella sp.]